MNTIPICCGLTGLSLHYLKQFANQSIAVISPLSLSVMVEDSVLSLHSVLNISRAYSYIPEEPACSSVRTYDLPE